MYNIAGIFVCDSISHINIRCLIRILINISRSTNGRVSGVSKIIFAVLRLPASYYMKTSDDSCGNFYETLMNNVVNFEQPVQEFPEMTVLFDRHIQAIGISILQQI